MQLVFVCPGTGRSFFCESYRIIDNKGVRTDARGRKILDARVALTEACPFCGQLHVYRADELACPLGS
jgi:predicted RNA-binding Zn-ribbon protein involved in translation (DUF1610 family)